MLAVGTEVSLRRVAAVTPSAGLRCLWHLLSGVESLTVLLDIMLPALLLLLLLPQVLLVP